MRGWLLGAVAWVATGCAVAPPSVCDGETCSGHGHCAVAAGAAVCLCEAGFQAVGTRCEAVVSGAECQSVDCSGRGRCVVIDGAPRTAMCLCDAGHRANGLACEAIVAGAECQGVDCSGHGSCVVVDGSPKTPLCVCAAGFELMGTTTCRARPADPCAAVSCGAGVCVTQGATPRCWCQPGFRADGLTCVSEGADGGAGPLAVPSTVRVSPSGRHVAFATIAPQPDAGPTSFALGQWVLRDLDAGTDTVLDPAPPVVCGGNGCTVSASLTFDATGQRALLSTPRAAPPADSSPGVLLDLATGQRTVATTLGWIERFIVLAPDLGWAIAGRQTNQGQGSSWSFVRPLSARPQAIATSCSDPAAGHVDARVDGTDVVVAVWTCATSGSGHTLSARTMPAGTNVPLVTTPAMGITATYLRPGYVTYTSQNVTWAVRVMAGATPMMVDAGSLADRSPDGRWAVLTSAAGSSLVDLDDPFAARLPLGSLRARAWSAPDTLFVRTMAGELWRTVGGAALTLVAQQTSGAGLVGVTGGVVDVEAPLPGSASCTVSRGPNTTSFGVPGLSRATFYGSAGPVGLGEATFWQFGGSTVARGSMYFDVLRGFAPAATNGYTFSRLP